MFQFYQDSSNNGVQFIPISCLGAIVLPTYNLKWEKFYYLSTVVDL